MARLSARLLPSTQALLTQLGERIRLARLRRGLTAQQVASRAGMAPMTLRSLERGGAGVTVGAYAAVLQVLGLEGDLGLVAEADPLGRALQDARLPYASPRAAKPARPVTPSRVPNRVADAPTSARKEPRKGIKGAPVPTAPVAAGTDGFVHAADLASLLDLPRTRIARKAR